MNHAEGPNPPCDGGRSRQPAGAMAHRQSRCRCFRPDRLVPSRRLGAPRRLERSIMRPYNLFRRKGRAELACAIPEDRPVPAFITGARWEFGGRVDATTCGRCSFNRDTAEAGIRYNGFYLFQLVTNRLADPAAGSGPADPRTIDPGRAQAEESGGGISGSCPPPAIVAHRPIEPESRWSITCLLGGHASAPAARMIDVAPAISPASLSVDGSWSSGFGRSATRGAGSSGAPEGSPSSPMRSRGARRPVQDRGSPP